MGGIGNTENHSRTSLIQRRPRWLRTIRWHRYSFEVHFVSTMSHNGWYETLALWFHNDRSSTTVRCITFVVFVSLWLWWYQSLWTSRRTSRNQEEFWTLCRLLVKFVIFVFAAFIYLVLYIFSSVCFSRRFDEKNINLFGTRWQAKVCRLTISDNFIKIRIKHA